MKKLKHIVIASLAIVALGSCKKFLDINTNPNDPTTSTPELVLPQAIAYTANNTVAFNSYGSWMVGYTANAGGFGGWGAALTYNYGQTDYNGLWTSTYDNLEDYHYVITETEGKDEYAYFNAAARIMRVLNFQMLVDQYNDIPYTEALQGAGNITPAYDDAEFIYQDLYKHLDTAINLINNAEFPKPFKHALGNSDVLFDGNMTRWKQLANTLKLKLLIRASGTGVFAGVTPSFDAAGFIADDALINPGYVKQDGKQNPAWSAYHSNATGAGAGRSIITTNYVVTFYNGNKISDENRATAIYRNGISPNRNQQGETAEGIPAAPGGSPVWYSGPSFDFNADDANAIGVLKGRNMGQPLMLAAESYFLQAEGVLKGILNSGDVTDLFDKGIESSFRYLYKNSSNTIGENIFDFTDPAADALAYKEEGDNELNRLVNIELASSDAQRLQAIITQKYIALNMIHGHESWAEFRRTGYPAIENTVPLNPNNTFVSKLSTSTTSDRTLGRVLYPSSEYQLNEANVPSGINVFSSFVFWDRRA